MSDNIDVVRFQSLLPHASAEDALHYLEIAGGDVEVACALYASDKPAPSSAPHRSSAPPVQPKKAPAKKPQEYYAGGSTNSGTAILGGSGEGERAGGEGSTDIIGSIIDRAKEGGEHEPAPSGPVPYSGAGRRLGHTEGGSTPAVQTGVKEEKTIKITFYRNGFVVEDGELREMDKPENRAFLDSLNKGLVPREIAQQHPNVQINIAVADHHDEEFVPQFKAFSGQGKSLAASSPTAPQATSDATPLEEFSVDDSKPSATIALQLLDNTRVEVRVNPSVHTINHLRSVATRSTPSTPSFDLWARDLPPRPLHNLQQTIEEARCARCVVFMKRK